MVKLIPIRLDGVSDGFDFDSIEILMEPVENIVEKLGTVLLAVSPEHRVEFADRPFDRERVEGGLTLVVQVAHEMGVLFC